MAHDEVNSGPSVGVALTVYNQNFALVKDRRSVTLAEGRNTVVIEDVASMLDPTTVHFKSLTAPNAVTVREQNYQYDLINPLTLLNKSVGKRIAFLQHLGDGQTREIQGTIVTPLSVEVAQTRGGGGTNTLYSGMVIRADDGSLLLNPSGEITLYEMPPGLIPRPRLAWLADCAQAGQHEVEISYMTNGVTWKADYVGILSANDDALDLTGWVTLDNRSGATYENAGLQLIAGDVRRIQPRVREAVDIGSLEMVAAGQPAFEEESLFEYHLYTLDGVTTVRQNEQKQMTLLDANNVPATKQFRYLGREGYYAHYRPDENYDTSANTKFKIYVNVENKPPNLGIPLPKGVLRLFKADRQGRLQFIGEDEIDHTPKDETLRLYVGDAFDIVGEHKRMSFKRLSKKVVEEQFEITIRNHRDDPADVVVVERAWADWKIVSKSHDFRKVDASTLEFPVTVAQNAEAKVTYTIRTQWF